MIFFLGVGGGGGGPMSISVNLLKKSYFLEREEGV